MINDQKKYAEAKAQLEEAIRIGPESALGAARNNLQVLQSLMAGKF